MKVTVEVLKIDSGHWMAEAEWDGKPICGYGITGKVAEAALVNNIQRQKSITDSRYVTEIDV